MKNTKMLKKLMSVVLSVAMLVSAMIVPSNAIVPGEDAVGGSSQDIACVEIDFVNQTKRYVPKSEIPEFTGDSTYDVLDAATRARMETAGAAIAAEIEQRDKDTASPFDVTTGTYSFVRPTQYLYSGVVVLGIFENNVCQSWGTGFMVNEDTLVSALHNFYDLWRNEEDENQADGWNASFLTFLNYNLDIRVFFDVDTAYYASVDPDDEETKAAACAALNEKPYIAITGIKYDSQVDLTDGDDNYYDWTVAKLASPVTDDVYYWDLALFDESTMMNVGMYHVGYPLQFGLRMVETWGTVRMVDGMRNFFFTSNCNEHGMSGGPMYALKGTVKCYGVGVSMSKKRVYDSNGNILLEPNYTCGIKMYDEMLNIIAAYMAQ